MAGGMLIGMLAFTLLSILFVPLLGTLMLEGDDNDGILDCEMDYDQDLDDDRLRPFDQNYNGVYDWLDPDMGGTPTPDNLPLAAFMLYMHVKITGTYTRSYVCMSP